MFLKSWRLISPLRSFGYHYRSVVTEANNEKPLAEVPNKRRTNRKRELNISNEFLTHFDDPDQKVVLESFSEDLLKKQRNGMHGLYIANKKTAGFIAEHVVKDLRDDQSLLELNPGPGLLTTHLLNKTTNSLLLYEPSSHFHPRLNNLIEAYPNREISLNKNDLNLLWQMAYLDRIDKGRRVDKAFSKIHRKDYENASNARLFAATTSMASIHHIINSVVFQASIMAYGRCELYLCLTPQIFQILTCSNDIGYLMYRSTSVLFQLLFEYEFIKKLDRKDFLPWQKEIKEGIKYSKIDHSDQTSIYFMRAVPRQNIYRYCLPENMVTLWFFMKQHLRARTNRVVPTLERWIPGSSARLFVNTKPTVHPELLDPNINLSSLPAGFVPCRKLSNEDYKTDINFMTEFGDLTPTQVLTIFDQFINWPEYNECSFKASLQSTLMKLHTSPEEAIEDLELPNEEDNEENVIRKRPEA